MVMMHGAAVVCTSRGALVQVCGGELAGLMVSIHVNLARGELVNARRGGLGS
jgi:hypothetical protein